MFDVNQDIHRTHHEFPPHKWIVDPLCQSNCGGVFINPDGKIVAVRSRLEVLWFKLEQDWQFLGWIQDPELYWEKPWRTER
jgi:hypothetical protein